ncbi:hypothetical protein BVG19_g5782 [[Candida] boidinii]|nr:hypothetical protein BVG19_g5782 [[Candida] boidinii]OWB54134.1 binding protein [[Candida] boidinii]
MLRLGLIAANGTTSTLGDFIDKFVLVYIDDILIYSKSAEEHEKHIKMVLSKLREHKLVAKRSKCEFFKDKLQFLGFVISKDGIHTDPDKVDRVKNWPTPTSRKQVQSFLGLVGFYRRFIQNHSKISSCLTDYIAKKVEWSKEQDEAFQMLKNKLITSPIVVAPCFDAGYRLRLSTDACDYALGYVLELLKPDGKLVGVVAYGSKKLTGALLNYSIREKEFLAVVEALKKWRYYLMQRKFIIRTDHHSLQYWKQQDAATQTRIAKWNDILSGFDFDLQYLPGTQNSVADALSRKPLADDDPAFTDEEVAELDSLQVELNDLNATEHTVHMNSDLVPQIIEGYGNDTTFGTIYDVLANKKQVPITLNHHITHFSVRDDKLLYFDDSRICIPHIPNVKEKVLHLCHDIPMSGHFSADKTYIAVAKSFYWKGMKKYIFNYVRTCDVCQRIKSSTVSPNGLFSPLPIPVGRWTHITMDFVTGIPTTVGPRYDAILVVVDRFSKRARFIPTHKSCSSMDTALLYLRFIFSQHGVPRHITSDKDIKFMSHFWRQIHLSLGTELIFTTTNHPQADGQSERTIKVVNQLLRGCCHDHFQNWHMMLPMMEFAYNSTENRSIKMTPFEADIGHIPAAPSRLSSLVPKYSSDTAGNLKTHLDSVMVQVKDALVDAQAAQEHAVNQHRSLEKFAVGDLVLLHHTALKGTHGKYSKMRDVYFGPFKLVSQAGPTVNAFEVDFITATKKHRTINVKFFKHYHARGSHYAKSPPVTDREANLRIAEVSAIVGYNAEDKEVAVTWIGCDPAHATRIPISCFASLSHGRLRRLLVQADHIPDLPPLSSFVSS